MKNSYGYKRHNRIKKKRRYLTQKRCVLNFRADGFTKITPYKKANKNGCSWDYEIRPQKVTCKSYESSHFLKFFENCDNDHSVLRCLIIFPHLC